MSVINSKSQTLQMHICLSVRTYSDLCRAPSDIIVGPAVTQSVARDLIGVRHSTTVGGTRQGLCLRRLGD